VSWLTLLAATIILALVAALVWWLIFATEGVYLGRRMVIWLYDMYARRYDRIKEFDARNEDVYLARPVLDRIPHLRAPFVLDVATGTGRLPLALLEQPTFQGRIIALDLSRRMLTDAARKLAPFGNRVTLLHHPAERLPFPEDTFDLVTCLEALEFMMEPRAALRELVRVLRPGGLLVITNRQGMHARLMPGQTWAHEALERLLRDEIGLTHVDIQIWQRDYRLVWAIKPGHSHPAGPKTLGDVWRCPRCGRIEMIPVEGGWQCLHCEVKVPLGTDGVIEARNITPHPPGPPFQPG
jgi:ubiquinone/menaquinone biosynthesis C-methylase UbiE